MSEEICAICLGEIQHGSTIPELNGACIHIYCQSCIVSYVRRQAEMGVEIRCPVCRSTPRVIPNNERRERIRALSEESLFDINMPVSNNSNTSTTDDSFITNTYTYNRVYINSSEEPREQESRPFARYIRID